MMPCIAPHTIHGPPVATGGGFSGLLHLQLKLKKMAKPHVRNKDVGAWFCYRATGGAIQCCARRVWNVGGSICLVTQNSH